MQMNGGWKRPDAVSSLSGETTPPSVHACGRGLVGDNENTAMPAGPAIITVISGPSGSIVDQLNNRGRGEIDAMPGSAPRPTIPIRAHNRVSMGLGNIFRSPMG